MSTLTVVVPCYNEASRGSAWFNFQNRLYKLLIQLKPIQAKVLLVDDGSSDNSVEVFNEFVKEHNLGSNWICLELETNHGKGTAVQYGLMAVSTDFALVLDADLSVAPEVAIEVMNKIQPGECYVGTRYAKGSEIVNERTPLRRFISFCCRHMVRIMFNLGVSDTQCGFKVLPASKCHRLTSFVRDTWVYDVEVLYNLKCCGIKIKEIPVRWENMERESTVRAANAILPSVLALFKLFSEKSYIKYYYSFLSDLRDELKNNN